MKAVLIKGMINSAMLAMTFLSYLFTASDSVLWAGASASAGIFCLLDIVDMYAAYKSIDEVEAHNG